MKLLITGGAGFVGSNLARAALERGFDLTVFDDLSRHGSAQNLDWLRSQGDFEFVHGDIRVSGDVSRVISTRRPEAVFHLAGQVAMTTSVEDPRRDFEINALGTLNLLQALREQAPETGLLYSSSNKVYRDLGELTEHVEAETRYEAPAYPAGFPEEVPFDPETPYGVSKGAADTMVRDAHRMFGQRTVVFRHSSMYGGRQFATFDQGWIGWFCNQALAQVKMGADPFTIAGNGKQVRDLLHGRDLVDLYFSTLECLDTVAGEAFNVGGGMQNSLSLLELLTYLGNELGQELTFHKAEPRARDQKIFVADNAKVTRMVGWSPRVTYAEGLSETLEWQRELMGLSEASTTRVAT